MSHELRTPANAILGHVELLLSGAMGPLSAEMRGSLGTIQRAGLDLLAQIDQAVRLGETLPFSNLASPDIDALIQLLDDAWTKAQPTKFDEATPNGVNFILEARPTRWLRMIATLLHHLGAERSTSSLHDVSPAVRSTDRDQQCLEKWTKNQEDRAAAPEPDGDAAAHKSLSVCEIDHSGTSKVMLVCPSRDRADFSMCVTMIEAALAMTGGSLVQMPGELRLIWPCGTFAQHSENVTA
ncbi:MAG: histidine kinase dimerization/phospho-acceptor domain-containing protein [Geminicoccaceae bacterium]